LHQLGVTVQDARTAGSALLAQSAQARHLVDRLNNVKGSIALRLDASGGAFSEKNALEAADLREATAMRNAATAAAADDMRGAAIMQTSEKQANDARVRMKMHLSMKGTNPAELGERRGNMQALRAEQKTLKKRLNTMTADESQLATQVAVAGQKRMASTIRATAQRKSKQLQREKILAEHLKQRAKILAERVATEKRFGTSLEASLTQADASMADAAGVVRLAEASIKEAGREEQTIEQDRHAVAHGASLQSVEFSQLTSSDGSGPMPPPPPPPPVPVTPPSPPAPELNPGAGKKNPNAPNHGGTSRSPTPPPPPTPSRVPPTPAPASSSANP